MYSDEIIIDSIGLNGTMPYSVRDHERVYEVCFVYGAQDAISDESYMVSAQSGQEAIGLAREYALRIAGLDRPRRFTYTRP